MVNLRPFRASYYNPQKIKNLAEVITPPYDVISPTQQAALYERHPHNYIRIDYGQTLASDDSQDNRYTRAAHTLQQWLEAGIFVESPDPGFYLHTLRFQHQGQNLERTDLFVLCEALPWDAQAVLRHEKTFPKHKADRLSLMEATEAHLSPVYCVYSDHEDFMQGYFEEVKSQPPLFDFVDDAGVSHLFWYDHQPERIQRVQNWFKDRQLFIADGHHRYETAVNYRKAHGTDTGEAIQDYLCMYLSNIYDPGLLVLPTHRLLKSAVNLPPKESLLAQLKNWFQVEPLAPEKIEGALADAPVEQTALVLQLGQEAYLLTRPKGLPEELFPDKSLQYRQLDVAVLQDLVLYQAIGFDPAWVKDPDYILFSPDINQIQTWLAEGEGVAALYLNGTPVQELCGVALAQDTMPPKSTYFYPKVPSGLLFARFATAL